METPDAEEGLPPLEWPGANPEGGAPAIIEYALLVNGRTTIAVFTKPAGSEQWIEDVMT